jgi:hypothetical protein
MLTPVVDSIGGNAAFGSGLFDAELAVLGGDGARPADGVGGAQPVSRAADARVPRRRARSIDMTRRQPEGSGRLAPS